MTTATGPRQKKEITAVIKNVTYRNADNGYMILKTEKGVTLCGVYHAITMPAPISRGSR